MNVSSVSASSNGSLSPSTQNASIVTRMTYDGLGNVKTLTEGIKHLSNGTEDDSSERVTTYGYDALGRQTSVKLSSVPVYNGISTDVDVSGSAVTSNSTAQTPTTQVVYDTLGNEIGSKDAAGNWTYNVYDQLGRMLYQIDAMGYVTGYTYDAFGNKRTTTRYNNQISGTITGGTLTDLQVTSVNSSGATIAVTNVSGSSTVSISTSSQGLDRTITSTYDRDNRIVQVSQSSVFTFLPGPQDSSNQTFMASPTTSYAYNAFGQVVSTGQLVNPGTNTWNYSYTYYNQTGSKAAAVDADGYLTAYQYDAEGNLTDQYEYFNPASGVSISGYTAPATTSTRIGKRSISTTSWTARSPRS